VDQKIFQAISKHWDLSGFMDYFLESRELQSYFDSPSRAQLQSEVAVAYNKMIKRSILNPAKLSLAAKLPGIFLISLNFKGWLDFSRIFGKSW
jgi:hypothetical protein